MSEKSSDETFMGVHDAYLDYVRNRMAFLAQSITRTRVIQQELSGPRRTTALELAAYLADDEVTELLPQLVILSSYAHGSIDKVRSLICRVANYQTLILIREYMLAILSDVDKPNDTLSRNQEDASDVYRRFLELSTQLDASLSNEIAQMAMSHQNAEVREAGLDYLTKLKSMSHT